ncbi:hypothetical protein [Sinanaerobacter sp. ZZT-01]|uniref:hypothetical protein n=1 Tax=Sinanaerobacter sp. ZZT-01 TaxID=3111540 RepID=UPI002D768E68|nr:hypothetical protein [Sinanaerobacter sp. ZZT-01]WRR93273.1 hypothetical protein U5921_14765 [Sinanaerobacter sp. ZZT-01]
MLRAEESVKIKKNCVVNLFKSKEEERRQSVQTGLANVICRTESTSAIKYIRTK